MQKRDIIQKIMRAAQGDQIISMTGVSWMGQVSGVQQQVGEAIYAWVEQDDSQPLLGVVALLRTLDRVTQAEADELHQAISVIQ